MNKKEKRGQIKKKQKKKKRWREKEEEEEEEEEDDVRLATGVSPPTPAPHYIVRYRA